MSSSIHGTLSCLLCSCHNYPLMSNLVCILLVWTQCCQCKQAHWTLCAVRVFVCLCGLFQGRVSEQPIKIMRGLSGTARSITEWGCSTGCWLCCQWSSPKLMWRGAKIQWLCKQACITLSALCSPFYFWFGSNSQEYFFFSPVQSVPPLNAFALNPIRRYLLMEWMMNGISHNDVWNHICVLNIIVKWLALLAVVLAGWLVLNLA